MSGDGHVSVTHAAQTFLIGAGTAGAPLRAELKRLEVNRVLLLASKSMQADGSADRLRTGALAGLEVMEPSCQVEPHAQTTVTEAIAGDLRDRLPDAVVALGGGSVSDTAKGVAILLAEGGTLESHCSVFEPPSTFTPRELLAPKMPVIAVPSTLSGAEITPGGGATTPEGVKRTFWDPKVAARVVVMDTHFLSTVPDAVLVTTGMNGLAHCVEGLYSKTANAISSALAVSGATLLSRGMRALGDAATRNAAVLDLANGAILGGLVISNARVGIHHAMCHVLGARLGLAHGVANSIMLPHALRFNAPVTADAQAAFAAALGEPALSGGDAAAKLQAEVGAPARLRDQGLDPGQLPEAAEGVMQDRGLYFNPRPVADASEVLEILQAAW